MKGLEFSPPLSLIGGVVFSFKKILKCWVDAKFALDNSLWEFWRSLSNLCLITQC